jgi:hypothetical protein
MTRPTLVAVLGLALTACFGTKDSTPTGDTSGATGDSWSHISPTIDTVTYGYDATEWTYSVEIIGWAQTVHLTITQDTSSPWEEDHDMVNGGYAEDGSWDLWQLTLPITTQWDQQESGTNTLFAGDAAMEATMAWRMDAYEDGVVVDCVVWAGVSSSATIVDTGDCREIAF